MLYLDNAATSWPKPECVYEAVASCLRNAGGNPGRGGHFLSRAAGRIIYDTREALARLFGIEDPSRVVLTQNATEAMNIALLGYLGPGDRVVTTSMEHNSVARPLRYLEQQGVILEIVPCDQTGCLNPDVLEHYLRQPTKAVVISHGSNVTGALQNLVLIGEIAARHKAALIVDAAQTAGSEIIKVQSLGISMLAFSGHKSLLGPQGTGGLYICPGIELQPHRFGGTGSHSESDLQPSLLPDMLESGTLNTPGFAGLQAGVQYIMNAGQVEIHERISLLTQRLLTGLKNIRRIEVYGPAFGKPRTGVVSFIVLGQDSGMVAYRLDREYGIASRAGLHCSPWAHHTIGTLKTGTIRFSPGLYNTTEEIDAALMAIAKITAEGGRK